MGGEGVEKIKVFSVFSSERAQEVSSISVWRTGTSWTLGS